MLAKKVERLIVGNMVLSGTAIKKALEAKIIAIQPFFEDQVEAAHVNLHLGELPVDGDTVTLSPKGFILAKTKERITLTPYICGLIEGRSKLAQRGISIEQSSTFIEPGTDSTMVLEIFNASDEFVTLRKGDKIAKMILLKVTDEV